MPPRPLAPRLLLFASVLSALLLLAEVALRVTGAAPDLDEFRFHSATLPTLHDGQGLFRRHPTRFYELAPHFRHGPEHLGREATGEWPFRGRPAEPAPPDLLRVAIVGDSCVYGTQLESCDLLGTRLQRELSARGLPADRVQVLSLGVPGYSTEQLALLMDEALDTLRLDAVVLYPAAWNDQSPALSRPDRELLAELAHPSALDWIESHSRLAALLAHALPQQPSLPVDTILAEAKAGQPPFGWRVPAADVASNVERMLARCAERGVAAVVVAPAHPPRTLAAEPRTATDAAAVLEAAQRAGAPALDGQRILSDSGEDLERFFSDWVHPSPDATALLAVAIADALAPGLLVLAAERPPRSDTSLQILSVTPDSAPRLGDVRVRVRLAGWTASERLPAVVVGGAPLLELRAVGDDSVEGWLMANGAGPHDLVVQTERGCALRSQAVRLEDPTVMVAPGPPARLEARGRPGDTLHVLVGVARRSSPEWSNRGALWLDGAMPLPTALQLDADGRAALELPELFAQRCQVQLLITPHGEPLDGSTAGRWSGVTELSLTP